MLNEKDIEDCESWEDAKSKLESDSRYQDAPNDEARRQWYMDYLGTCALEGIFLIYNVILLKVINDVISHLKPFFRR